MSNHFNAPQRPPQKRVAPHDATNQYNDNSADYQDYPQNPVDCIKKGTFLAGGQLVTFVLGPCCRESLTIEGGRLVTNYCHDCQKETKEIKYPPKYNNYNNRSNYN